MRYELPKGSLTPLICLSLVLGFALGCRRLSELSKKDNPDDAPSTRSTPGDANAIGDDQSLVKKSNLFITECFNKYSNRVIESYNRYQSWHAFLASE